MSLDLPILNNNLGRAACADVSEELKRKFYAKGNAQLKAKEVCNGMGRPVCPVREQCLAEIRATEESPEYEGVRHGVWGGMTAREREEAWPRPARPRGLRRVCASGRHELDDRSVVVGADGSRRCRECAVELRAARYERDKLAVSVEESPWGSVVDLLEVS